MHLNHEKFVTSYYKNAEARRRNKVSVATSTELQVTTAAESTDLQEQVKTASDDELYL